MSYYATESRTLIEVAPDGTITAIAETDSPPDDATRLPGIALPGFANVHSHAFHRALRGRTHGNGGTFWTWRETMYALAGKLDPDSYYELARLVYAEMVVAGYTSVGEFHYLHHGPKGTRYADPNAMGNALAQAAVDAGIRLTLLDTCYLAGGIGAELVGVQQRFGDDSVDGWRKRVDDFGFDAPNVRLGAAIHSVRAVPCDAIGIVAEWAGERSAPLHAHLSEQIAENNACQARYGRTPTELLHEHGALGPETTAVHATHLTSGDIALLAAHGCTACFCPTTEADLADGIGPARELVDAGVNLALGSDQHAVIDPFLEARGLEAGERLRTGQRGRFAPVDLLVAATAHAAIGWPTLFEIGAPADFVTVRTDTIRTAGCAPDQLILAATSADVATVVVGGRVVARDGRHDTIGDVGPLLAARIERLWGE
ncbi:MAG TPA: formimidoylglutamate deiminase [Pseudonocardiaceae bacterium]|nr:formimidoylglutamate deiminase [Pseudonocardiaceae bacterium]